MVEYVAELFCPECGGEVEAGQPREWIVPGKAPEFRHADDKTGLCPVMTSAGYLPAEPVEHAEPAEVGE